MSKKYKIATDYSKEYDIERIEDIESKLTDDLNEYWSDNFNRISTKNELEYFANHILYGRKTEDDNYLTKEKYIYIDTKRKSNNKNMVSLEGKIYKDLNDGDWVDERIFLSPNLKRTYTKKKPKTINRETDAWIPGMKEIWAQIDELKAVYKEIKEKGVPCIHNNKEWDATKLSKLRDLIIELHRDQYSQKDIYSPTMGRGSGSQIYNPVPPNENWDFSSDSRYVVNPEAPEEEQEIKIVRKHTIDLSNPKHVYPIIRFYSDLRARVSDSTFEYEDVRFLLYEFDEAVKKASNFMNETQEIILDMAMRDSTREEIRRRLDLASVSNPRIKVHSTDYISTLLTGSISKKIAEAHDQLLIEHADFHDESKWKECSLCRKRKHKSLYNFSRVSRTGDGMNKICRKCEKDKKQKDMS